jgi:hypothetical protein
MAKHLSKTDRHMNEKKESTLKNFVGVYVLMKLNILKVIIILNRVDSKGRFYSQVFLQILAKFILFWHLKRPETS